MYKLRNAICNAVSIAKSNNKTNFLRLKWKKKIIIRFQRLKWIRNKRERTGKAKYFTVSKMQIERKRKEREKNRNKKAKSFKISKIKVETDKNNQTTSAG